MRPWAVLCLLLASCKGVDLVPFVGGSAYTNDVQAVHAGVSFVPHEEVAQERPSFRSWRDERDVGASDGAGRSKASEAVSGPGNPGLDVLAATGEWADYLRKQGWSVAAPGAPTKPVKDLEDDGGVHLSPTALAAIVTALAAVLGGSHIKGGAKA
jgi:hypothetical protein